VQPNQNLTTPKKDSQCNQRKKSSSNLTKPPTQKSELVISGDFEFNFIIIFDDTLLHHLIDTHYVEMEE